MKRLLVLLLLPLSLFPGVALAEAPEPYVESYYLHSYEVFVAAGNLVRARQVVENALYWRPGDIRWWQRLAQIADWQGDSATALRAWWKVAETTDDPQAWRRWRRNLRQALRRTLKLPALGPVPTPEVEVLEECPCDGYRRLKIAYETLPGNWISAYLLLPPGDRPKPAVLCPHGHVQGGKQGVVDPDIAPGLAYGHALARQGCVVLAPDNAGMGERDGHTPLFDQPGGCMLAWARLNHFGLDLTGLRVFDLMAGIHLLCDRPEVDARRLGCAGLSGGCWLAQVVTALDRRIRAVILSGFFTTFAQTVWHGHCICHHPHGIGAICDMPDISALIAPRPQFVESGIDDTNYPHQPAFSLTQRAYEFLGAADRLGLDRHAGGHLFRGEESIPWLVNHLRG